MSTFTYTVSESCLSAAAASYIIKYTAEVETTDSAGEVRVEMVSVHYETDPTEVQRATECVREAAAEVLTPRGLGATIRLHDFILHPVDFKPQRCQRYTKQYLTEALDKSN